MELLNKNIVITGASKGLGKEIAKKLSIYKPNLILISRNIDKLEVVQQEIKEQTGKSPLVIKCDVSDEADVRVMTNIILNKYQHIDVLINNAAIGIHKESEAILNIEMRKLFEVNFYGPYYIIKSLLPLLKLSNAGYILNIGSLVSKVSFPYNSVYAATKSALNGFTAGLRLELRKYNIKVGIIHPGLMKTSFQESNSQDSHQVPSFFFLKPDNVAATCVRMIQNRKKIKYLTWPLLWMMKLKQLFY